MKKIDLILIKKIDLILIISIAVITIALCLFFVAYFYYQEGTCVSNPVSYAQNHSEDYGWDDVVPIYYHKYY